MIIFFRILPPSHGVVVVVAFFLMPVPDCDSEWLQGFYRERNATVAPMFVRIIVISPRKRAVAVILATQFDDTKLSLFELCRISTSVGASVGRRWPWEPYGIRHDSD